MPAIPPDPALRGVGVVIDDRVNQEDPGADLVSDLLEQIRDAGIPCVLYDDLPPENQRAHLHNVAFILLDWELWRKPGDEDALSGATVAPAFKKQAIKKNIQFLKELKKICFAPVFIFSNAAPKGIEDTLKDEGLLSDPPSPAFILVRSKAELARDDDNPDGRLLQAITEWTEQTPSVYLLSRWRESMLHSQNTLFWDLYEGDVTWPAVLWKAYEDDKDYPEHGLMDVLHRNTRARMHPLDLDANKIAPPAAPSPDREGIRRVLETAMIVPADRLPAGQYAAGDLFAASRRRFLLNIRCDCDCIPRSETDEEPVLYLLSGKTADEKTLKEFYDEKFGLVQKLNVAELAFPVKGKPLRLNFDELRQATPAEIERDGYTRFGRITPPHSTEIRQRYALYLQREGLPRIPKQAVHDPEPKAEGEKPKPAKVKPTAEGKPKPAKKKAAAKRNSQPKANATRRAAKKAARAKSK